MAARALNQESPGRLTPCNAPCRQISALLRDDALLKARRDQSGGGLCDGGGVRGKHDVSNMPLGAGFDRGFARGTWRLLMRDFSTSPVEIHGESVASSATRHLHQARSARR